MKKTHTATDTGHMVEVTPEGSVAPVYIDPTPMTPPEVQVPQTQPTSIVIESPDGTQFALSVDNDGNVQASVVS